MEVVVLNCLPTPIHFKWNSPEVIDWYRWLNVPCIISPGSASATGHRNRAHPWPAVPEHRHRGQRRCPDWQGGNIVGQGMHNQTNLWRHLRKGTLLRNKYLRPWSDAAHNARRLIRPYDICRSWASKENIFVAPYAVLVKNTIAKLWN